MSDLITKIEGFNILDIDCCEKCTHYEFNWDAAYMYWCKKFEDAVFPIGVCPKYEKYPDWEPLIQ